MVTIRANEISNIIRERIEQYNRELKIGTIAIALNLESNNVGVVLMGNGLLIQEGSSIKALGRIAQIHVSEAYLDRVVNALAKPIDGRRENNHRCVTIHQRMSLPKLGKNANL
ncbi:hypothetical protein HAX54_010916 [Datura stramonium]|uniref:ATPase F1/V1/A1 complex alpha/beta subunit N-terminal domain-containing protein n=1 Tax=Datura stramonium TaxID=4076 RepID=A0ABS8WYV2_DATST|nr:hypothetical protein [Datura stramonium]